jgi:predicted transcriptional regulator
MAGSDRSEGRERGIKRPDLYVVARFLEKLWTAGRPVKRTRLQMAVGLNYGTFMKYLDWMLDRNLIAISKGDQGGDHVTLTKRGYDSYDRIVNWINGMIPGEI